MNNEQQKDEIFALESIYNNEEFSYNQVDNQFHCTLKIFSSLPEGFCLTYKDLRKKDVPREKVTISHLPPIKLYATLPHDYPDKSPPEFTICCSWLSYNTLLMLFKKLDELWQDNKGQEILFTWAAFLQNDVLEYLKISNELDISYAYTAHKRFLERPQTKNCSPVAEKQNKGKESQKIDDTDIKKVSKAKMINLNKKFRKVNLPSRLDKHVVVDRRKSDDIVQILLDYNEERMTIEFKKNFYTCKICFLDKSGESCTQFKPCQHIFCKECIVGYLEVKIKDGAVQNIRCPEEKCDSEALPGQIKDLVSPELFAKYDSTLLAATLDTMLDIVYCPRRHCQYPVSKEPNEKMASCPACNYVFCIFCKMVYHGVEPCRVACEEKQKLVDEYLNGTKVQKQQLENRYGQKQLKDLVENIMSENWIQHNSKNCPHCQAAIEKSDGCNKMTCNKCNTYFCYICGVRLNKDMPYFHYQNPQSKCYNQLYQGLIEEDLDDFQPNFLEYDDFDSDDDDLYDEDFQYNNI